MNLHLGEARHPLLDEETLLEIHSGEHTDLPLKAEAFLVVGSTTRKQVQVKIRDMNGSQVGELRNGFELVNGEMRVRYQIIEIDSLVRGHGFARSYYGSLESEITKLGADVMTLHTWRVGSYLFAGLGFDFDVSGATQADVLLARQQYLRRLVDGARSSSRITDCEFDQLEPSLFSPLEDRPGSLSRPLELTKLPGDVGWRLLDGLQWDAIKWLA